MKQMKKISWMLVLLLVLNLCLAVPTFAEESAVMWLEVQAGDDGVTVNVCANTTITDGQIGVHYDYSSLSYSDITVQSDYVMAHAVNPEKQGVVQIAWIAPGDYALDGTKHVLMQLYFAGDNIDGFSVYGTVFTSEGVQLTVQPPEGYDMLQVALESAKTLKADMYTAETYAQLQAAIEAARAELSDPTVTPERLETARQNVINAVRSLLKPGQEPPTVPATTQATVPATQPAEPVPQNNNTGLIIAIVAICVIAAVVVVIIIKRKGNK